MEDNSKTMAFNLVVSFFSNLSSADKLRMPYGHLEKITEFLATRAMPIEDVSKLLRCHIGARIGVR